MVLLYNDFEGVVHFFPKEEEGRKRLWENALFIKGKSPIPAHISLPHLRSEFYSGDKNGG